jgi:hypothetical protein
VKAPRVPERVVQAQIRTALLAIGAKPYTIGRPPRRDAVFKGRPPAFLTCARFYRGRSRRISGTRRTNSGLR